MKLDNLNSCVLCAGDGGVVIAVTQEWRLVRALDQEGFPFTYRVIWNEHLAEFSDLSAVQRQHCMEAVAWVEQAMRAFLQPDKVDLAALGNVVAHLHWHIIARYEWDSHFPAPVWAAPKREGQKHLWQKFQAQQLELEEYFKNNIDFFD